MIPSDQCDHWYHLCCDDMRKSVWWTNGCVNHANKVYCQIECQIITFIFSYSLLLIKFDPWEALEAYVY